MVISSDLATPDLPAHLREQRNCLLCARCLLHACIRRVSAITQRASAARRRQGVSWVAGKRVRCAAAVLNRAAILAASHMACARARRRKILSFAVSRQCRAANASVNRPKYAPRAMLSTAASTMSPRARLTRCVSAQSVHMHQPHGHTVIRSYGHTPCSLPAVTGLCGRVHLRLSYLWVLPPFLRARVRLLRRPPVCCGAWTPEGQ